MCHESRNIGFAYRYSVYGMDYGVFVVMGRGGAMRAADGITCQQA